MSINTICVALMLFIYGAYAAAEDFNTAQRPDGPRGAAAAADAVLGPDDVISIWALGVEEIPSTPLRIDPEGMIDLPTAGRVRAAGLTAGELKERLIAALRAHVREPQVAVAVVELRSRPVSVLGSVNQPGVFNIHGSKSLSQVLALAGGLREDAGLTITISRAAEAGPLPVQGAIQDATGRFHVGTVRLARSGGSIVPGDDVLIKGHDVINVAKAAQVYVVGQVTKPGSYKLTDREQISVLEAISIAGGLVPSAATGHAFILREIAGVQERQRVPLQLKKILAGKNPDVALAPSDILVIPDSAAKRAALRAIETAVNLGTGIVIWR